MGADEEATLSALRRHRAECTDPKIAEYGGRIANTAGDSILIEFPSVVEALRCAMEIQRAMATRNRDIPQALRIQFRIGINVGDVMEQDGDLLGDGVNIAARIESLAAPGGISISRTVRDQVRDRMPVTLEDRGEIEVKNIARPVRVFRVLLDGEADATPVRGPAKYRGRIIFVGVLVAIIAAAGLWRWQPWVSPVALVVPVVQTAAMDAGKPSIAVLPFTNMSGDPQQEYFSDGITEDIITDLSKISGLFVVARNSSFKFRGRAVDLKRVGRELGVRYVLEGSVRRAGQTVRINAQLIDVTTGRHLWADRYDGSLADVFALQDAVTRQIVRALAVQLNALETRSLNSAEPVHPQAYDLVLRGLALLRRYTRQTVAQSRDYFQRAIALSPNYARAHADMAVSYANTLRFGWSDTPDETGRIGLFHAERALAIDDRLPVVYFAQGMILLYLNRHDEALAATRIALEIDPNYADSQAQFAFVLNYMGHPAEGLEAMRRAIRLNPLHDFNYRWVLGQSYFYLDLYREAAAAFEDVIQRNPEAIAGHLMLAATYALLGRIDDAQWSAAEILTLQPGFTLREARARTPYRNPRDLDRYIDALAKAGLPQ
jgi:adenylate cyclase